jgi:hypothetical protein
MNDADIFVDELHAELNRRLARMRFADLTRAVSRRGVSGEEVADILRRHDMLRVIEDDGDVVVAC